MSHVCLHQVWIKPATLALKLRGDITRSPKTGVSVAPQKGLMSSKSVLKNLLFYLFTEYIKHQFQTDPLKISGFHKLLSTCFLILKVRTHYNVHKIQIKVSWIELNIICTFQLCFQMLFKLRITVISNSCRKRFNFLEWDMGLSSVRILFIFKINWRYVYIKAKRCHRSAIGFNIVSSFTKKLMWIQGYVLVGIAFPYTKN